MLVYFAGNCIFANKKVANYVRKVSGPEPVRDFSHPPRGFDKSAARIGVNSKRTQQVKKAQKQ